ncbi:hypothetical protein HUS96_27945 [Pseudomonas protegens]|nr:hypothetical protein [Pseudomonas protegens]
MKGLVILDGPANPIGQRLDDRVTQALFLPQALAQPAHGIEFPDVIEAVEERVGFLSGVEGFITALPLNWTRGENNDSGLNKTMIADILDKQDNSVRVAINQFSQGKRHNS